MSAEAGPCLECETKAAELQLALSTVIAVLWVACIFRDARRLANAIKAETEAEGAAVAADLLARIADAERADAPG